ncbi:phosphotransferase [Actinocorallia cavernae]|uniref:Phosphotransferase n=2 Tax=Actinomycetes TaxID=1760 RepID=A0ABN3KTW4_9ACTN
MTKRAVVRRGNIVERSAPYNAPAIHAYLLALRDHGFEGAPIPIGSTENGRERMTFIPGDVAVPPYEHQDWALGLDSLASVGRLLRQFHEASAATSAARCADDWPRTLADPHVGPSEKTVLCHNDVSMANVVFRDGRAVALIDFDMSAPGRPVWDVAVAARYWAVHAQPESAAERLRVLADSYGLSGESRAQLPATLEQVFEVARSVVAARVAEGDPRFVTLLDTRGGWQRWDRVQAWLVDNRDVFAAALFD